MTIPCHKFVLIKNTECICFTVNTIITSCHVANLNISRALTVAAVRIDARRKNGRACIKNKLNLPKGIIKQGSQVHGCRRGSVDSITCGGRNHLSELAQVKKKWHIRTFSAFHSFACQRNVANMLMVVRIRQIIVSTAGSRLALSKIQDNSVAKICKSTECNHDHTLYRRASARSVQRRKVHNFYFVCVPILSCYLLSLAGSVKAYPCHYEPTNQNLTNGFLMN